MGTSHYESCDRGLNLSGLCTNRYTVVPPTYTEHRPLKPVRPRAVLLYLCALAATLPFLLLKGDLAHGTVLQPSFVKAAFIRHEARGLGEGRET